MRKITISMLLLVLAHIAPSHAKVYTFGVVPQQSATRIAALWGPILQYVNTKLGTDSLRLVTAKNIPIFEQKLEAGEYDFAYMNPYHYVLYHEMADYDAILKRKDQPIKGILVTSKESGVKTIQDLNKCKLAFPSPAAFAASLITRAHLRQQKIAFTPVFVSSHDSVYLNVSKNLFKAGGGVMRTLNNVPAAVRKNLSVLWTSTGYTPHAFAVLAKIDKGFAEKVQKAFLELNSSAQGKTLLASIKIKHGLERASNSDWDDIRALNLHAMDV